MIGRAIIATSVKKTKQKNLGLIFIQLKMKCAFLFAAVSFWSNHYFESSNRKSRGCACV